MNHMEIVQKMQVHGAEAAVHLSALVDLWVDLIADNKQVDGKKLRDSLEDDATAISELLQLAEQLGLGSAVWQLFAVAIMLKAELIHLNQRPPEYWLKKATKG